MQSFLLSAARIKPVATRFGDGRGSPVAPGVGPTIQTCVRACGPRCRSRLRNYPASRPRYSHLRDEGYTVDGSLPRFALGQASSGAVFRRGWMPRGDSARPADEVVWGWQTPHAQVVTYDVTRPLDLVASLESLVFGARAASRPILVPFGPKVFALACMFSCGDPRSGRWGLPRDRRTPCGART